MKFTIPAEKMLAYYVSDEWDSDLALAVERANDYITLGMYDQIERVESEVDEDYEWDFNPHDVLSQACLDIEQLKVVCRLERLADVIQFVYMGSHNDPEWPFDSKVHDNLNYHGNELAETFINEHI